MELSLPPCCRGLLCRIISNSPVGKKAKKSNSLMGKQPWAKSGIELGENGSIFPRPKGKARSQIKGAPTEADA